MLVGMAGYGGNNGCWPVIDALTGMCGYESCGFFGALAGIFIGSLVGIVTAAFINIPISRTLSIVPLIGAFVLPIIYGLYLIDPLDIASIIPIISINLVFVIASLLTSLILVGIGTFGKRRLQKKG